MLIEGDSQSTQIQVSKKDINTKVVLIKILCIISQFKS